MLKSTLTTWGDGVFESIRSIPRDWNEFHILWMPSVSVMVNLSSDRKQHSVSRVFSATTLFHSDTSLTDLEPISLCTSLAERRGTAPSQSLQSMWRLLSELMVLNLCQWHFSVWGPGPVQSDRAVYGSAVLWCLWTHRVLGFKWCVWEREARTASERETGGEREVHFSFPGEANESKQQQRLRRKTIWLFHVYRCRRFIFDSL